MRLVASVCGLMAVAGLASAGCNGSPFIAQRPFGWSTGQSSTDAQTAQLQELSRRISQLDANNRDLHTEVARYRQDLQKERDLRLAVQKQLNDAANQLSELQVANSAVEQRLAGLQASARQRGAATITANSSLQQSARVIEIPGVDIRQDGDLIRIPIPAEQLFVSGSDQFRQGADVLLDQVASAISRNYPRQIIGIEGHTDSTGVAGIGSSGHQIAAQQAMAVFNQIVRSGRIPSQQLFTLSHGPNHPRFSNADAAGRTRNRRIELVVYPDTVDR